MFKAFLVSVTMVGSMVVPVLATAQVRTSDGPKPLSFSAPGFTNFSKNPITNPSYVSLRHEFEKGVRQYREGNMHLAKIAFRNVADARKRHYYQSRAFLGLIAAHDDDHQAAARHFKVSLHGNPNVYGLKAALGLTYVELGELSEAQSVLSQMKRKQYRHYVHGSNEAQIKSAIEVLEHALDVGETS